MTIDVSSMKVKTKIYLGTTVSVKFDVAAFNNIDESLLDEACERFARIKFDLCVGIEDIASRISSCTNFGPTHANKISIDWTYGPEATIACVVVATLAPKAAPVPRIADAQLSNYSPL